MREDTILRRYSMSKPITPVALMTRYEEGRFERRDPIAQYIPQLADLEVALSTSGTAGSAGEYSWGGAAGTPCWVDPVENLIGIFMVQSLPHLTRLKDEFKLLTYGALEESYR